jgi:hypothetical protein
MKKGACSIANPLIYLGGAEEDRTPDLRIANATLSQLSYRPMSIDCIESCKGMQVANIKGMRFPRMGEVATVQVRAVFKKHPQVFESIDGNSIALL